MARIVLNVCAIEFEENSNTLWIHNPQGGTTLRIKCAGKIRVNSCAPGGLPHGDLFVDGDINICVPKVPS